jgi:hypothetical protein
MAISNLKRHFLKDITMQRFQYAWLAAGLLAMSAVGCTEAENQLPTSATDSEVQQLKADEQRVATEESARMKQGL